MAHRPDLSITLPHNLEHTDNKVADMPRTPEPCDQGHAITEPPPPPKQTFKVRRKRNSTFTPQDVASDIVLPTIEMSSDTSVCSSPLLEQQPLSKDFLAPTPVNQRFPTPKTPEPRSNDFHDFEATPNEWDLITNSYTADSRFPARAGSVFSDSSISTSSSSRFSAMPTSPASETTDPFLEDDVAKENNIIFSPHENSPCVKRFKKYRDPRWTSAMDDHLWMTFMLYLSDPTLTPFKLMPGQVPPLGLCHKVAARAKKTWKPSRGISPGAANAQSDAANTIRATEFAMQSRWPRCEKAVRTRLRVLCKSKPSLPMHYQRLLRTRSPSPFTSSSPATRSSEPPTVQSAFSNRDLNVSLATATAPSMQPEGPLAQLASDKAHVSQRPQSQRDIRPEGWFDRIGRSQAHQKSLSLQSGLGLDIPNNVVGPLASPFGESSGRSHLLHSMITTKSLGRNNLRQGNPLGPPFEGDPTMRRSLKRRFRSDEEKPRRLPVKDVFGTDEQSNTNTRNRGFSLGAVAPSVGLEDIFAPQTLTPVASSSIAMPTSELDHEMAEAPFEMPHMLALPAIGSLSVPRRLAEPTPRLGSPFVEASAQRQHNTFPRSLFRTQENPQPFQQRLQELARQHAAKDTWPHPY